jgi:hypothetical protein
VRNRLTHQVRRDHRLQGDGDLPGFHWLPKETDYSLLPASDRPAAPVLGHPAGRTVQNQLHLPFDPEVDVKDAVLRILVFLSAELEVQTSQYSPSPCHLVQIDQ